MIYVTLITALINAYSAWINHRGTMRLKVEADKLQAQVYMLKTANPVTPAKSAMDNTVLEDYTGTGRKPL